MNSSLPPHERSLICYIKRARGEAKSEVFCAGNVSKLECNRGKDCRVNGISSLGEQCRRSEMGLANSAECAVEIQRGSSPRSLCSALATWGAARAKRSAAICAASSPQHSPIKTIRLAQLIRYRWKASASFFKSCIVKLSISKTEARFSLKHRT